MRKRSKVGLALSGGSVRGLCYIGFLKVIEREKIPIDYIAGTSIGSVVGALYCSGMRPVDMEKVVSELKWETFMDFAAKYTGILDGKRIEKFMRRHLGAKCFKDLRIPFAATAVDVNTGEEIVFEKGDVAKAVRASMSIPGVFTPVKFGRRLLVDGAVLDPIPIGALKGKVDKVIAIDLSVPYEPFRHLRAVDTNSSTWKKFKDGFVTQEINNLRESLRKGKKIPRILLRFLDPKYVLDFLKGRAFSLPPLVETAMKANHLTENEFTRLKLEKYRPDLVIRPGIKSARYIEFDKAPVLIKCGERAAEKHLGAIRRLAGL